ncbi:fumarylacetoacetate hydrolase family protein [Allostreptomyces psammosilenae]|uniref:2-keto-4-pentenoate hydratase/2-oxohepta-3-ene-1,7-dioic acid hydratase in catechol pathway n=1 Tax=Allostreptomyces psammosilenae TaxID=1892865 RepID=A0A852ZR47_9ACTN|nr:fumarylacetoacetate hydrolase family protein [Allostreptomyces psammosilenae]NYI04225.1 2-keto-4-pentenoate hydratase/2-oxohepta-3-ene-1,7-dioic acid hydratase in catechol pathway [Allostreptomyces psammosilenae]
MKLLRVGEPGRERPAVLAEDGRVLDASGVVADFDAEGLRREALDRLRAALAAGELPELPGAAGSAGAAAGASGAARVGAPIARPGKVVCIGLNYRDHAAETGAELPTEPVVFMKAPNTVIGPYDTVLVPRGSTRTDYEVELGVVIGSTARYLATAEEGLAAVAGYAVSHDVSEREFQLERGGTWDKGKSCETFNPLGPWLVTADEVPDPQALGIRLRVGDETRQDSSTAQMLFGVGEIIRYLSQFMVLEPGDLVNTGTPAGVALGHPDPKPWLRPGDVVTCEIDGLGASRQPVGRA